MDIALIKAGKVENVIVADAAFAAAIAGQWDRVEPAAPGVGIGWGWDGTQFVAPAVPEPEPAAPAPAPAWAWYIDIGPFFDRFGTAKMAVLTSADAGVQAIIKDAQIRKWIDLQLPEVAQSVAYVGTKVSAVTAELQAAILTTPVAETENLALRRLYFS